MSDRAEPKTEVPVNAVLIEAIAQRVAQLVRSELGLTSRLLTPSEVAVQFGVSRTWVYEHANELGAVRLGTGPRARLRFDANRVISAITSPSAGRTSPPPRNEAQQAGDLLPIYGRGQPAQSSE